MMSDAYAGGCACGAVRYAIPGEPVVMVDCQCRHCQQRSGTGHGSYLTFAARIGDVLAGSATEWQATGEQGTVKSHGFCATCGTPVYLTFDGVADLFTVHAGSLDDPGRYRPQAVTWTESGEEWDQLDPALPRFRRMMGV